MKRLELGVNALLVALGLLLIFIVGLAIRPVHADASGRSCNDPNQQWSGKAADCWGAPR